jgi:hypothetical protein
MTSHIIPHPTVHIDLYLDRYRRALCARDSNLALHETPHCPTHWATQWSELELHALWYSSAFGTVFRAVTGELIEILQFGFWNKESGPDFVHASIKVEGNQSLTGAIEIHLRAHDWENHRHSLDPAYEEVILHVFLQKSGSEFFARTAAHRNILQIQLDPTSVQEKLQPLSRPGRCSAPLRTLQADQIDTILETAARLRLEHKAKWLQRSMKTHGIDEALFQAVAIALGYKSNKLPFLLLAQRLTLRFLQKEPETIEAILFGTSGFLEHPLKTVDGLSEPYWHKLWSQWWKYRSQLSPYLLNPSNWHLGGIRPINHPQRRLGALAELVRHWREFRVLPGNFRQIASWFESLNNRFWDRHYTLSSRPMTVAQPLIGRPRAMDIIANVIFPLFIATGREDWSAFKQLRAQMSNRHLEIVSQRLFGDSAQKHNQFMYQQQGLLQIYEDFCINHATDCAECKFPLLLGDFNEP